jgi:DNA-binding beta-propeller fold protein YncE
LNNFWQRYREKTLRLFVVVLLALGLFVSSFSTSVHATDDSQFFPETGHTVSGKFLQYWKANGGLATYGYPITDAQPETDPETGKTFLTQWFERNRFELHPENAGTKYEVLLGLLGKDLRREALSVDPAFQRATPQNQNDADSTYFQETGHNLSGDFATYWKQNGGLERFGFPISESQEEVDPETGKVFVMQWFERARFEAHPENREPYNVLLGLLGNQIKQPKSKVEFSWKTKGPRFASAIAVDKQGNLYVPDIPNATLQKYNNAGQPLGRIGSSGSGDGQFGTIGDVTLDKDGNIYVTEILGPGDSTGNLRVQKFSPDGKFLMKFGSQGEDPGQFRNPGSIAVDGQGNIYVSDLDLNIVNKYDKTGNYLLSFGNSGGGDAQLQRVAGLVVDSANNLYVLDSNAGAIKKFDGNGNFLGKLVSRGTSDGQLFNPAGLAIDSQNNFYVNDKGNDGRIQKFDAGGKFLLKFGGLGGAAGQFNDPLGLAVDSKGNIFVTDSQGESAGYLVKFQQR